MNQTRYNQSLIGIRNPELRQVYTQLRDDEMRSIVKLQKEISRSEAPAGIISKIFPDRPKY